ncbi:fibrous sheath CABYR-binding protein-like isoform X1 [Zingiber officinale]|nr:fibrous sheath CABYR-binding protein-like isoform X1 [Zingiber officinale]XP_042437833.1 fibrous sheath CABYR-binding protein-like isoform X1 [Zingiber officinale]
MLSLQKMEKIVSDDTNITDEPSLSKPEDVEGNEQGGKIIQVDVASAEAKDEKKKEDIAIEEAKEDIERPAEDKGLHDSTDVPNTQPAEVSEASFSEDPVEAPKEIAQESFEISNSSLLEIDKHVEPSSQSHANGTKDPVGAPKELEISETATEEEKGVQESTADVSATDDNPVEQVPETVAQEPSEATLVTTTGAAEKPADEEVTVDTVELVSRQLPKEELPHSGATEPTECPVNEVPEIAQSESSDVVPTEPKQVQIEIIAAELSDTQVVSEPEDKTVVVSSDDTPTSEVVEGIAELETEAKMKDQENNIDNEKTTLTDTAQSITEGVVVTEDAENGNLQVQNPNSVELTRDIKMVGVETEVPSNNQLETESKPNKQTLLDKFANENTEEKKQEPAQVDPGILTETNKDGDATKADEETTKAELSGKKSKNIMSKVKQSIVKVKKALIGKSPSSKTMVAEGIDDTKAK